MSVLREDSNGVLTEHLLRPHYRVVGAETRIAERDGVGRHAEGDKFIHRIQRLVVVPTAVVTADKDVVSLLSMIQFRAGICSIIEIRIFIPSPCDASGAKEQLNPMVRYLSLITLR